MSRMTERLDRLPFSRPHRRLLIAGGLGYTFDAMDGAVIAFVLPVLAASWSLTAVETGILGSSTYVGYFFGALCAGIVGDRMGRKLVMMYALAIYALASLASAFAMTWSPFLWLRTVAGFGIGAESVIIAPFLSEFVAARYRGQFTGSLAGFFSFGYVGAALLGYLIIPAVDWGWRAVLVLTALPIFLLLWWRRVLPESPRWLESRGRFTEAEAVVAKIERESSGSATIHAPTGPTLSAEELDAASVPLQTGSNLGLLFKKGLRSVTFMSWVLWFSFIFSYYSFFVWIPGLLVRSGMTVTKSFGYSLMIYAAQIPGYYCGAYLNERIGRRSTIVAGLGLGACSAFLMSFANSEALVIGAGILLSFFMNIVGAGIYAYTPEIFPTRVRATGMGAASSIGRLGAIAAPVLVGYVYPWLGFAGVFGISTAMLAMGALAVLVVGPETRGLALEEIERRELGEASVSLRAMPGSSAIT